VETGTGTARDHQDARAEAVGTTTDLPAAIVTCLTTGAVGVAGVAQAVDGTGRGTGRGIATRTNSGTSDAVVIRRLPRRESLPRT
jgi:hypothetical protein